MVELESERLLLRDALADDLLVLLDVYLSNPDFVRMNEGARGEQGYYDLEMLQRDWQIVQITPGGSMVGIWLKETGEAVGMAQFLDENPDDGMPWLGALQIAGPFHRRSLGTEAFACLADHFREDRGWTTLRLGVRSQNAPALAFWRQLGFTSIGGAGAINANAAFVVLEHHL
jgi:RimJ/RimL family protein N-acetyltransferase